MHRKMAVCSVRMGSSLDSLFYSGSLPFWEERNHGGLVACSVEWEVWRSHSSLDGGSPFLSLYRSDSSSIILFQRTTRHVDQRAGGQVEVGDQVAADALAEV